MKTAPETETAFSAPSRGRIWTKEEDAVVSQHLLSAPTNPPFTSWKYIAYQLPGRTGKQIRERWNNYLNPVLNHGPFTREDDLKLWKGRKELGSSWVDIAIEVFHSTRSENKVKNRWYSATFKKFVCEEFGEGAYNSVNRQQAAKTLVEKSMGEASLANPNHDKTNKLEGRSCKTDAAVDKDPCRSQVDVTDNSSKPVLLEEKKISKENNLAVIMKAVRKFVKAEENTMTAATSSEQQQKQTDEDNKNNTEKDTRANRNDDDDDDADDYLQNLKYQASMLEERSRSYSSTIDHFRTLNGVTPTMIKESASVEEELTKVRELIEKYTKSTEVGGFAPIDNDTGLGKGDHYQSSCGAKKRKIDDLTTNDHESDEVSSLKQRVNPTEPTKSKHEVWGDRDKEQQKQQLPQSNMLGNGFNICPQCFNEEGTMNYVVSGAECMVHGAITNEGCQSHEDVRQSDHDNSPVAGECHSHDKTVQINHGAEANNSVYAALPQVVHDPSQSQPKSQSQPQPQPEQPQPQPQPTYNPSWFVHYPSPPSQLKPQSQPQPQPGPQPKPQPTYNSFWFLKGLEPRHAAAIEADIRGGKNYTTPSTTPVGCWNDLRDDDVLCMHTRKQQMPEGNKRFNKTVDYFKPMFLGAASHKEKWHIARTVVLLIRNRGGRFVLFDTNNNQLYEVGDEVAERRAHQALQRYVSTMKAVEDVVKVKGSMMTADFSSRQQQKEQADNNSNREKGGNAYNDGYQQSFKHQAPISSRGGRSGHFSSLDSITSQQTKNEALGVAPYSSLTATSKQICVPMKPPLPPKFQGDMEKFKDAKIPQFNNLVNFPSYITKKLSPNVPSGMKCCVMCGQACRCSYGKNKGDGSSTSDTPMSSSMANIPAQNKGLCTICDINVWIVTKTGLEIKWCKGCKNFRPWAAWGDKGMMAKCFRCRDQAREKYALQKEKKRKARWQHHQQV